MKKKGIKWIWAKASHGIGNPMVPAYLFPTNVNFYAGQRVYINEGGYAQKIPTNNPVGRVIIQRRNITPFELLVADESLLLRLSAAMSQGKDI